MWFGPKPGRKCLQEFKMYSRSHWLMSPPLKRSFAWRWRHCFEITPLEDYFLWKLSLMTALVFPLTPIVEPGLKTCDFFILKELKGLLLVSGYSLVPSSACCECAASFRLADFSIERHRCVDAVLHPPSQPNSQIRYLAIVVNTCVMSIGEIKSPLPSRSSTSLSFHLSW